MFHEIPESVEMTMQDLERRDKLDRGDGTAHLDRLRQIPPETGRFLAIMAGSSPQGAWLEVGTSAGYSALWIALACRERSAKLVTYEILANKALLARETFERAGVTDVITLVEGDFLKESRDVKDVSFCFLDAEKNVYQDCLEILIPRMVRGGLLIADNVISHATDLQPVVDFAMNDVRLDAVVVPIGKGELVCRKR